MKEAFDEWRRNELATFLRKKRHSANPTDYGIEPTTRRRAAGLRRSEVAERAGIGTSWYVQLEQGRSVSPSETVTLAVARTLRMTPAETDYVLALAGLRRTDQSPTEDPAKGRSTIDHVLDAWLPMPAHVLNRHWQIVVANEATTEVFSTAQGENCLQSLFLNDAYRARLKNWDQIASSAVSAYRQDMAVHWDDPSFHRVVGELQEHSSDFNALWDSHTVIQDTPPNKQILIQDDIHTFKHSLLKAYENKELKLILHSPAK